VNVIPDPDKPRPARGFWLQPEIRPSLEARDYPRIYRFLTKHGYSQREIGALTGQSQSIVSTIINGRPIMAYDVMRRAATGLGIPLCLVGMASRGHRCRGHET
jgi:Helix-turn-helix